MAEVREYLLAADVSATNTGLAIFAHRRDGAFDIAAHRTVRSRTVRDLAALVRRFLREEAGRLSPPVRRGCIDFAGPVGRDRSRAFVTNLGRGFTAEEIFAATPLEELSLVNDFEAVGYGLEVLVENRPEAFVRLSRGGRLPRRGAPKPTAVVIGAGTGLGTAILVAGGASGRYRPVAGEGGHADFVAVDELDFRVASWIRAERNRDPRAPLDCEKIVSGPGLVNVYDALRELEPDRVDRTAARRIQRADPYDRPAAIVQESRSDALCRAAVDLWLSGYARAAKNSAIFPLAPGGVFLAGGIAAKILSEIRSGIFMKEFLRCDVPDILKLLRRTPVWVVTDYRIGLYGCANVAAHFAPELAIARTQK